MLSVPVTMANGVSGEFAQLLAAQQLPAADKGVMLLMHMYTAVYRYRHEFKGMKVCCIVFLSARMYLYLIQDA